ncbi:unnamed protein product [Caenorhabditis sp. 36 PRJEB53466]|nr:unnamed protein product [Caenorhabditis sp. 36 PRJEB53466]
MATNGAPPEAGQPAPQKPVPEAGYQTMIEAESVDDFVHAQTTRAQGKDDQTDLDEICEEDRLIERFIRNGEKNRFTNIVCYDEVLDTNDKEFYVHANTFATPYGNFIISQAPTEASCADHLHLMWIFNVRTVVCLVSAEEAGGYFDPNVGGKKVFKKYTMRTLAVDDVKRGLTVYQCELSPSTWKWWFSGGAAPARTVHIISCPTDVSALRPPTQQSALMEYMWSFERAEELVSSGVSPTTVLVHGVSGTRRCASFVVSAIMCRQMLATAHFSAIEQWIEVRKRRAHAGTRKHDYYSSLYTAFVFAAQCGCVSETEETFLKAMEVLQTLLEKHGKRTDKDPPEPSGPEGKSEA